MLKKVMKYDLRSQGRIMLPAFGLALALALGLRLVYWLSDFFPPGGGELLAKTAVNGLGVVLQVGTCMLAMVVAIYRFYQSMLSDEAYLTFTLPVKASTQVAGRMWTSLLYVWAALLLMLLMRWLILPTFGEMDMAQLLGAGDTGTAGLPYDQISAQTKASGFLLLAILGLSGFFISLMQAFAAISIGATRGESRLFHSIFSYFVINLLEGIVSLGLIIGGSAVVFRNQGGLLPTLRQMAALPDAGQMQASLQLLWAFMPGMIVSAALFSAVNLVIASRCFENRLNLQ